MFLLICLIYWNLALLRGSCGLLSIPFRCSVLISLWSLWVCWRILAEIWRVVAWHQFFILVRKIRIILLILALVAHLENHVYILSYVLLRLWKLLWLLMLWGICRLMVERIWILIRRDLRRVLLLAMYWMSWWRHLRRFTMLSWDTSVTHLIALGCRIAWIHTLRHIRISAFHILLTLVVHIAITTPLFPLIINLLITVDRIGVLLLIALSDNIMIAALITF